MIAILHLPGCSTAYKRSTQYSDDSSYAELEARLVDIPMPIGIDIDDIDSEDMSYIIHATATLSLDDINAFYTTEMERCGWKTW